MLNGTCYLWVENYQNIPKPGFNFSPRFSVNIWSTNKLTINGNQTFTRQFLPENIIFTGSFGGGKMGGWGKVPHWENLFKVFPEKGFKYSSGGKKNPF